MTKLLDTLGPAVSSVKSAYSSAVSVRDSKQVNAELKKTAYDMAQEFTIVGSILDNLRNMAHRVDVTTEQILIDNIKFLQEILINAEDVLKKVKCNQNFFQSLFKTKDKYQKELHGIGNYLQKTCLIIQSAMTPIHKVSIPCKEFADFRKVFQQTSEKRVSVYDFSIIRDKPNSTATINTEEFDDTFPCYMKLSEEHVIFSHQIRTWTSPIPKDNILKQRRDRFRKKPSLSNSTDASGDNTLVNLSLMPTASLPSMTTTQSNKSLDFTEFTTSHDDICGMALTKEFLYVATKHDISKIELSSQTIFALYGSEEVNQDTFKHITYLYIPSDNENILYVVDNDQHAVLHYKISNKQNCFELVYKYIIVANVNETPHLVACIIFNGKLFVSDDANNCLHIFDLNNQHQSLYLRDNSMTPFIPGSLCVCNNHLYVVNCSLESPSIIIFDRECNPVDWFKNQVFEQILAIDICPNLNELFILTTTSCYSNNTQRKRPLIVTADPCLPSK